MPPTRCLRRGLSLLLGACAFLIAAPPGAAHAAVSFVGGSADQGISSTYGAPVPAGTQAGDLMIGAMRSNIYAPSAPGGWTMLDSQNSNKARTFWRWAVAGDAGSTIKFTISAFSSWAGSIAVFRGVDPTTPFAGAYAGADTMGSITTVPLPGTGNAVARNASMRYSISSSGAASAGSFSAPSQTVISSASAIVSEGTSYEAVGAGTLAARTHVWGSAGGSSLATSYVLQPPPCAEGGLGVTAPTTISFPSLALTGADATRTTNATVDVDDERGSGTGWNLSLTSTTFTAGALSLPTSATTLTGITPTAAPGRCSAPTNSVGYPIAVPAASVAPAAVKIFNAAASSGAGPTDLALALALAVPANARIGTYASTWTFTVANGP